MYLLATIHSVTDR